MDVEIDNTNTVIKTFANTVENAVDNIVKMASVDKLFNITNEQTKQEWEFNEDIKVLRELRLKLPENLDMTFGIKRGLNGNIISMSRCSKHGSFSDSVCLLSRK